ncbi:hypothetical protein MMC30_004250 [Trapelia coarctata]|nr:hypothetical protein [Trapelia coarctata]
MRTSLSLVAALAIGFGTVSARPAVSQIGDGQPQAPVSQISDGQIQTPVSQIADGQIQAPTPAAAPAASATASPSPSGSSGPGAPQGIHSNTYNEGFFLGIPYAQPPLWDLRFRNPQPLNTTISESRAATAYSTQCVGHGGDDLGYVQLEDCLTLNVVRPLGYEGQQLPVAMWFDGGGNSMGGSNDLRYNLSFIVENSMAIGVSANYRLSVWGFLYSEEVAGSGQTNLGLRDQRLPLHWLQENNAAFGGDPTKVTIWGESAGALDVGLHLVAYNCRDDKLFRAGIMESGNPSTIIPSMAPTTINLCMMPFTPFKSGFAPVIDGDFIQRNGSIQLLEGDFVHVPIISGSNTDEGASFGPVGINNATGFLHYLEETPQTVGTRLNSNLSQQILAAYPMPTGIGFPAEVASIPTSLGAEYRPAASPVKPGPQAAYPHTATASTHSLQVFKYVPHFQEEAFVFYNIQGYGYDDLHNSTRPFLNKPQSYIDLSRLMTSSWASSVHDLDPNSFRASNAAVAGSTVSWPMYDVVNPMDYVFDATVSSYAEPDTYRVAGINLINEGNIAMRR